VLHAAQAASCQAAQEVGPERLGFGQPGGHAEAGDLGAPTKG
jgi:hypothetical protein